MDEAHILVVDDDAKLRDLLVRFLSREGFRVTAAEDAAAARDRLRAREFDLIGRDVLMPGESGVDLTRALRRDADVPILMLTAVSEAEARIAGLEAGADDYLAKPFEPRELVLRIQSILRRAVATRPAAAPATVDLGALRFDAARLVLTHGADGTAIRLTTAEQQLLAALVRQAGRVLTRQALAQAAEIDGGDRAVDVQITRLRRKIEPDARQPRYLQTVRGKGYVLRPD